MVPGALRTYQEGRQCGDMIHHLYVRTLRAERLTPEAAINKLVTCFHRITAITVRVDVANGEEPQVDLTRMLRCPYACLVQVNFRDHWQLAPTELHEQLHEHAAIPGWVHYEHRLGPTTSRASACPWTGSPVTSSGISWPTACATCPPGRCWQNAQCTAAYG